MPQSSGLRAQVDQSLLMAFESHGAAAFGESWGAQLSSSLMHELSRFRDYRYTSLRDLLRVIRNKRGHFYEMNDDMQRQMGPLPDGFLRCDSNPVCTGAVCCWQSQ